MELEFVIHGISLACSIQVILESSCLTKWLILTCASIWSDQRCIKSCNTVEQMVSSDGSVQTLTLHAKLGCSHSYDSVLILHKEFTCIFLGFS